MKIQHSGVTTSNTDRHVIRTEGTFISFGTPKITQKFFNTIRMGYDTRISEINILGSQGDRSESMRPFCLPILRDLSQSLPMTGRHDHRFYIA